MATYVNDLRLKEIATGDESGTWGTSTNTNLELKFPMQCEQLLISFLLLYKFNSLPYNSKC